jgi:two-component system, NarL family, response regulator DesR
MVKDAPSDQLIDVLRRVAAGERVIDSKLALATLEMKENPLSEREALTTQTKTSLQNGA